MRSALVRGALRILAVLLASALLPSSLLACACGCGIFDVSTSGILPTQAGGFAYLEFDYTNQNKNWSGVKRASDDLNNDKQIRTGFFTAGVQYMVDRRWGFMAELPYWSRYFKTTDADSGNQGAFTHSAVGDLRLRGVYSGFSSDMSSGLTFGLKLPSGDFTAPGFDRDTQIGTGSTDALLGAYHMGRVAGLDAFGWFANAQADLPVISAGGYRPGSEANAVVGGYYDRWSVGGVKIVPLLQAIGSYRWRDSGILAKSNDSGYQRVVAAPGLELNFGRVRVYGDVGFPLYQRVNGNQLVANSFYKLNTGYSF